MWSIHWQKPLTYSSWLWKHIVGIRNRDWRRCYSLMQYLSLHTKMLANTEIAPGKRLLWVQQEWSHHPRTLFQPGRGSKRKPATTWPRVHGKLTGWTAVHRERAIRFSGPAWEFGEDWSRWRSGTVSQTSLPLFHHQRHSTELYDGKKLETKDKGWNLHPLL